MFGVLVVVRAPQFEKPKFKANTNLKYIYRPSPYRAVSTLHLGYKTSQLMLYREIIAVCSEIHTKHINIQSVPRNKHTPSLLYKPVS